MVLVELVIIQMLSQPLRALIHLLLVLLLQSPPLVAASAPRPQRLLETVAQVVVLVLNYLLLLELVTKAAIRPLKVSMAAAQVLMGQIILAAVVAEQVLLEFKPQVLLLMAVLAAQANHLLLQVVL